MKLACPNRDLAKALNAEKTGSVNRAVACASLVLTMLCIRCSSSDSCCSTVDGIVEVLDTVNNDIHMKSDLKAFVVA